MSILSRLFGRQEKPQAFIEINNTFSSFSGTGYNSAAFRAAVDAIGRHAAKLQAHSGDKGLETLLASAPNAYMSGYDLLYKTAAAYFTNNNAFMLLQRDGNGRITAIYPITPQSVEFRPGSDGALYLECLFPDGRQVTFAYSDIIHLRRHFLTNDLLGAFIPPAGHGGNAQSRHIGKREERHKHSGRFEVHFPCEPGAGESGKGTVRFRLPP